MGVIHKVVAASALTETASAVYRWAIPLMVLQFTSSALALGNTRAVILLPSAVLGLVIGSVVDGFHKKRLLIALLLSGAFISGIASQVFEMQPHHVELLYVVAFLIAFNSYAIYNAQNVVIHYSVLPDDMPSAMTAITIVGRIVSVIVPIVTSMLLVLPKPSVALLICSAAYLVAVPVMMRLNFSEAGGSKTTVRAIVRRSRDALTFMTASRTLLVLSFATAVSNLAIGMFEVAFIVLLQQVYRLSIITIGVTYSAAALVGVLSAVLAPRVIDRIGPRGTMGCASLALMGGFGVLAGTKSIILTILACCAMTFASVVFTIAVYSLRQQVTPREMIGAVVGLTSSVFKLFMPAAVVAASVIIVHESVQAVFLGCAFCMMVVLVLIIVAAPTWSAARAD